MRLGEIWSNMLNSIEATVYGLGNIHVESFLNSIKEDQHLREIEIDQEVQATA